MAAPNEMVKLTVSKYAAAKCKRFTGEVQAKNARIGTTFPPGRKLK